MANPTIGRPSGLVKGPQRGCRAGPTRLQAWCSAIAFFMMFKLHRRVAAVRARGRQRLRRRQCFRLLHCTGASVLLSWSQCRRCAEGVASYPALSSRSQRRTVAFSSWSCYLMSPRREPAEGIATSTGFGGGEEGGRVPDRLGGTTYQPDVAVREHRRNYRRGVHQVVVGVGKLCRHRC
jgi:hypothetical protein